MLSFFIILSVLLALTTAAKNNNCENVSKPLRSLIENNPNGHSFCLDLLKFQRKTTITTATITFLPTSTITIFATTTSTHIDYETFTTTSFFTETDTETSTVITTSFTHTITPNALVKRAMTRDDSTPPAIPPFLKKYTLAELSAACPCVSGANDIPTRTFTVTSTTTSTPLTTSTSVVTLTTDTTVTTTTTVDVTTTSTITVTETQTVVLDICDVSYNPSGNGIGDTILTPPAADARSCCNLCQITLNCVANAFPGSCQLLVKTVPLDGAPVTPQCPLGVEHYNFLPGPGVVYPGPCGGVY